ncbi:MAG: hypothetical protein OEX22_12360 [Cyclobacteriaceae bacterium]|nr:hypothetical protein [Cyclobacteriaceae bacterium]
MFKTLSKIIFFTLLTGTVVILVWQTFFEKLSDLGLSLVAVFSTLVGAVIGFTLQDKHMSGKSGRSVILFFISMAVIMIAYGIYDAVFIHREGMDAMFPFILMVGSLVPFYIAFMAKFFIKKEEKNFIG